MSRKKAVVGGVGALSALLVSGVLLAPAAGATTAGSGVNSAFAISASGLLTIKETPAVDDSDGFSQESLAKLDLPASLVSLHVLNAQAGAEGARASVADVSVGLGVGKPLLSASAIEAQCDGSKATSSLAKAKIGDLKLDVAVPANTGVSVPGVLSVVLNKQVTHKDGSVTVTAISINVDNVQKIDIASATCAPGDDGDGGGETTTTKPTEPTKSTSSTPTSSKGGSSGSGSGDKATSNGKAPTPTPVKAHLDVTG
ncbi:choice-of-anchor P family protein [Amycolatopsis sp.]|uniref:choice-of-anchor P family protein n=1 Tax=Amycolatopsis sp. TaxID=37632 RepID=UPI002C13B768|nr:choice-of-anchor P family protein [Amycolatopsis sp.]HVV10826.1 choice-of-anchor P family protein [Amycolatopsis sp.]